MAEYRRELELVRQYYKHELTYQEIIRIADREKLSLDYIDRTLFFD